MSLACALYCGRPESGGLTPVCSNRRAAALACHRLYLEVRNASPKSALVASSPLRSITSANVISTYRSSWSIALETFSGRHAGSGPSMIRPCDVELGWCAERHADHLSRPPTANLVLELGPRRRGCVPGSAAGGLATGGRDTARAMREQPAHAPARRDMAAVVPPARISCQTAPMCRERSASRRFAASWCRRSSVSPSALMPA